MNEMCRLLCMCYSCLYGIWYMYTYLSSYAIHNPQPVCLFLLVWYLLSENSRAHHNNPSSFCCAFLSLLLSISAMTALQSVLSSMRRSSFARLYMRRMSSSAPKPPPTQKNVLTAAALAGFVAFVYYTAISKMKNTVSTTLLTVLSMCVVLN